jgi:hypothetical protein
MENPFRRPLGPNHYAAEGWKHLSSYDLKLDQVSALLWLACDFEGSPGYALLSGVGTRAAHEPASQRETLPTAAAGGVTRHPRMGAAQ